MRFRSVALVLVLSLSSGWAVAHALDQNRGDISGTVFDAEGTRLPGVAVSVTGPERRNVVTDAHGEFLFANLQPGTYEVRSTLPGFVTVLARSSVRAGQTERLALQMVIGAVTETVGVNGGTPMEIRPERVVVEGGVPGGVVGGVVRGLPEPPPPPASPVRVTQGAGNTESYERIDENGFHRVATDPLSTFSIDVDTASYANVRRFLSEGSLPPAAAVRVEEMINYFRYDYPQPSGEAPFSITTELAECPWNSKHGLALVGIQGRQPEKSTTSRNLVFLIDVSGSMASADKLPLVRTAMRMLADTLTARDRVAIVVYAGATGIVLPSTTGDRKAAIHRAIVDLGAGGSTNGGAGIRLAYAVARRHFVAGGVNRVILATDGDFNVGVTSQDELVALIEEERASGIFLSVLGVGTGNLKDSTMEKLADRGNGNYSYLDSLHEARKVLVREAGATLTTIAKDVKIQIEFNPRIVGSYRLIGYENRLLKDEDFNDDRKDAGEIGAGHSVTALYEIVPAGVEPGPVDPLKYQRVPQPERGPTAAAATDELMTVKVRYKAPDGGVSRLVSTVMRNRRGPLTPNLGFASAVAEFGMLLRKGAYLGSASFESAAARARAFQQRDPEGYRSEFIRLAELAGGLRTMNDARR